MSRHHTSLSGGFHETGINITYVSSDKPSSVGSRNRPDSRRCDLWLLQLLWIVTGDRYAGSGVGRSAVATGGSTVEINNFAFAPAKLTVPAGTSVSWKFKDSTEHTVTADDNSFTSEALDAGQTYEHTFNTKGTLAYHCSIHPFMKGSVEVK
jgi:plastocyanin